MDSSKKKVFAASQFFSIDHKEPNVIALSFQALWYAFLAISGNAIFIWLVVNDWYSKNFFTKLIAYSFVPVWLISVAITIGLVWLVYATFIYKPKSEVSKTYTKEDQEQIILNAIKADAITLAKKKLHLTIKDEYGIENDSKWEAELRRYVKFVLPQKLDTDHHSYGVVWLMSKSNVAKLREIIDIEYRKLISNNSTVGDLNPLEFEQYCSRRLEAMGWTASITKGSGDQGADVLANKNGKSLVLQVKKYSKPVGNKAVQEAIAAQKYYRTDMAAVVTNQSYTKSARELAELSGILLLHHTELDVLN